MSFNRSAAPYASTSWMPGRACSVWSRPVASSAARDAGNGSATRTSWIFWPVGAGSGIDFTFKRALSVEPLRRQAWTSSVWPLAATPSASSLAPNAAEPATGLPELLSNTATSQSPPWAESEARTSPFALAVTVRWTTPAPEAGRDVQSRRSEPGLLIVVSTRSAAATAGPPTRIAGAHSAPRSKRFMEVLNEVKGWILRAGHPPEYRCARFVTRPGGP